ncbi:MAG: sugar ABC transporter substrate-binding protein [Thermomicrobiales bacterium]
MSQLFSRRTLLKSAGLTAGAIAAGAAVSGVTSLRPATASAQDQATLTWWDYYDGANADALQKQLASYASVKPNVKIERTYIPFADLKQKLLQGAAAGDLPDIVVIDNPDHQAFASLGILEDLTDRISAWGQASTYFEGPWNSTMFQNKNYGIPDNSNCLVLWTNDELLTAGSVEAPKTWDELTAAVTALSKDDVYGLAVSAIKSEEGTFQWLPFLWETGADIPTIDSDGGRKALQLWTDYVKNGWMSKAILNWKQSDVLGQFQNGKAAMMVNGPWQIPVLKADTPNLKWHVSVLPSETQSASILGGENTAIIAGSSNLDAAWDLLTWRQTDEPLKSYLLDAGKLPSKADLAQDKAWTGDPVINVFIEQLKVAKPRAYGDRYPDISTAIQEAIQAAVGGSSSVEDALKKAQATITPLLPKP